MARRLYLVRHGRADRDAWDGDDFDRPLTPDGRRRLERQAAAMAEMHLGVSVVVTSPLVRAAQTAEILAEALAPEGGAVTDERLRFGFDLRALAGILRDHPRGRLLLVGHEPSFSLVVGTITGGSDVTVRKASLVRVDLTGEDPPRGSLEWLVPSRVLAGD